MLEYHELSALPSWVPPGRTPKKCSSLNGPPTHTHGRTHNYFVSPPSPELRLPLCRAVSVCPVPVSLLPGAPGRTPATFHPYPGVHGGPWWSCWRWQLTGSANMSDWGQMPGGKEGHPVEPCGVRREARRWERGSPDCEPHPGVNWAPTGRLTTCVLHEALRADRP